MEWYIDEVQDLVRAEFVWLWSCRVLCFYTEGSCVVEGRDQWWGSSRGAGLRVCVCRKRRPFLITGKQRQVADVELLASLL